MHRRAERSPAEVTEDADVGLAGMTAWLVDRRVWVAEPTKVPWRRDRYRPADPSSSRSTLMPFVCAPSPGGELTTPAWAATAVIARVAGLLDGRFGHADDELIDVCGPIARVVRTGAGPGPPSSPQRCPYPRPGTCPHVPPAWRNW